MSPAALETRDLHKNFGALQVARAVNFTLERGARHALIGPNGAGKTSFVNLLTGVLRPSAGRVLLDGDDVTRLSQGARARRGIARTFQINQLFRGLSVLENVCLAVGERSAACDNLWRPAGARPETVDEAFGLLESLRIQDDALKRSGWSKSPSRWGSVPRCCCSTSPPRAFRRQRATSSWTSSMACRATSRC
jgi:branched-chain amino acid transport system ATP-binding protein